ncbi:cation diffusion facilitator family transporter [Geoalkalibacter halelectricus]|uniref:Cation diffusion facilitator family transporter n=1 Tax=Geoalkalibacter halelectricus TaxID=2847045 RepID=A0ABY5ZJJ3_9BACT|nr:cation diffusion facilitator family transporter [Geoalkalibacter halelectricus]MDO3378302.1 cation diffusion facilitator family transporter [Geoalkalibacter halelectricus]UWZ79307.1 cation diffusion facilitator family transporter [Geoalkalibacter halelectricus]
MATGNHFDQKITRGFIFAIILTSVTFVAELIGGLWTNSLALLSDAAHVFSDLFALALSLMAIKLASRPATDRRTYGWHRAEILASLINGTTLLIIAGGILFEAWRRILDPQEVRSLEMFIIATMGLVMNLIVASRLHGHSHDDLNVRSAFLHVIGDAMASVGVIIGGVVMLLTGWYVVDALVSVVIVVIIGFGALRIIRAALHILLEGVPAHIDINEVVERMRAIEGVNDVHHVHCWSICSHITSLSAHIDVEPHYRLRQGQIVGEIEELLAHDYHITNTTLQCECSSCLSGPVIQQLQHRPRRSSLCSHGHGSHEHHHS